MKTDSIEDIHINRFGLTTTDLQTLQDKITKKLKDIRDKFKISFIGRVSTGKSSIINSILGDNLLPVSDGQTTKFSIFISGIIDNIFRVKEGDANWETFKSIDKVKDYLLKIQNTSNNTISKIEIELPIKTYKILKKCTLIDNPAIGYSDELDEYVLNQCYRSCYLYVLVIDAVASISDMENKFLSALQERRQISEIKVLLNFSDRIKDDELEIALNHHGRKLKKSICNSDNIFVFSGYAYTENRIENVNNYQNSKNGRESYLMKEKLFRGEKFIVNDKIIDFLRCEPSEEEISRTVKNLSKNFKFRIERFVKSYAMGLDFLEETEIKNSSEIFNILNRLCKLNLKKEKVKMNEYKIENKLEIFFNTIISNIQQIDKELSRNSVDILKENHFLELWKNLEDKRKYNILEWNLRCILFFTDILLIAIRFLKKFNYNSTKEFVIEILNRSNSENYEQTKFKKPFINLMKKMKRKGFSLSRYNIITDIESILKNKNNNKQDLIISNSLILIECYRKKTKKTSMLNCANQH